MMHMETAFRSLFWLGLSVSDLEASVPGLDSWLIGSPCSVELSSAVGGREGRVSV